MRADPVLTVNRGSSTIKFAVFSGDHRVGKGQLESHDATALEGKIRETLGDSSPAAIGHRIVHGGLKLNTHQRITPDVLNQLRDAQELDLAHLPGEISLVESLQNAFPGVPQVACFDTAFHRDLPRVAQLYGIPRRYLDAGVRRLGFHGLSYEYLMEQLRAQAGDAAANGRVVLSHLGAGCSMVAVHRARPLDTTMGFTPLAGLVMATRPGDIDPGLVTFMMRSERVDPAEMDSILNRRCGLSGVSDGTSDMRELLVQGSHDLRAKEAVDLFCYQARKQLGGLLAVLGGLDTLVLSGGIGEHSPELRARICEGFEFIGLQLDDHRNAVSDALISSDESRVVVRVIPTDEESVMARIVSELLSFHEGS